MTEGSAPETVAWIELDDVEYETVWSQFEDRFGFQASILPEDWPGIREPTPSLTFDLSALAEGPRWVSAYDAINAEALRAFVWALPEVDQWLALDWQHPAYWFRPAALALAGGPARESDPVSRRERLRIHPRNAPWLDWELPVFWEISVYPNGDYYSFLTPDMTVGTFGHPWEKTLCVFGEQLIHSLGASLAT